MIVALRATVGQQSAMSHELLRAPLFGALARNAHRRAISAGGRGWSYAELESASRSLASHLASLGVGPGVPVALVLQNSAEYVISDLAIAALGATKVPVNLMLSNDEISFIVSDSGAKVCIIEAQHTPAVAVAADGQHSPHIIVRDSSAESEWSRALRSPELTELPSCDPNEVGLIMYTGGTTGRPKGVMHSQRGLVMNMYSHMIESELRADDVFLVTSPLPHSAGFFLQTALLKGATVVIETGFDTGIVLDRIERDRVSCLFMVPTMIYRLLDAVEARPGFDASSLRTIIYGAAPITVDRLRQGLRLFGAVFMQIYAQSEAPNFLTRLRRDDHSLDEHASRLRSCGQSVIMAEVKAVRDDGSTCDAHEVGEVVAASPYTMLGYLGRDEATAETIRDGWLHTGDLGYFDEDGYLFLVDRKNDMIITGGLNVYSSEVEQAMSQLEGVNEVAAVGVPHPDWGEAIVAFVVAGNQTLTASSLLEATKPLLSSYKRPKRVVLVDSLPTTAVGKINKKALRGSSPAW